MWRLIYVHVFHTIYINEIPVPTISIWYMQYMVHMYYVTVLHIAFCNSGMFGPRCVYLAYSLAISAIDGEQLHLAGHGSLLKTIGYSSLYRDLEREILVI